MGTINKIRVNGVDYVLAADSNVVTELDNLGDGTEDIIFIGTMAKPDEDKPITYDYLKGLLADNKNNKVFEPTTLPITIRYNWEWKGYLQTYFILYPANHTPLYMLSSPSQNFMITEDDIKDVKIDFPTGSKDYKFYRFENWLIPTHNPITYTF